MHLRLDRHRLEGLDRADALHQKSLVFRTAIELLLKPLAKNGCDAGRDHDVERKRSDHDPGQERRIIEHHRQKHEGEGDVDDEGQRRTCQEVPDVLQFAHPRHRVARPPRLEIGDRQRDQMLEKPRAQFDVDPVGGVREHIGAQASKHRFENRNSEQTEDEHVEGGVSAMRQHLVGDDLEEQRGHQCEKLKEK